MATGADLKVPLSRRRLINVQTDSPKLIDHPLTGQLPAQGTDPSAAQETDPLIQENDQNEYQPPVHFIAVTRNFTHRAEINAQQNHIHTAIGELSFGVFDGILAVISLIFFYYDWVNKILLIRSYLITGQTTAWILTTVFATAPHLVTALMGLRWYYRDYIQQKANATKFNTTQRTSKTLWTVRVVMTLLLQGSVIRQIEYINHGVKSNSKTLTRNDQVYHLIVMVMEAVDSALLTLFGCFLESAPQLVLQIYLVVLSTKHESLKTVIFRAILILTSWISISWSLVNYNKSLRLSLIPAKKKLTISGTIFMLIWRTFEVGPRVVVLALFASYFKYYIFLVIGIHWYLMTSWNFSQNAHFFGNPAIERLFEIICAYVMIFCFMNLRDSRTRLRMILFYILLNLENIAMAALWYSFTFNKQIPISIYHVPALIFVGSSLLVQIIFQMTYYRFFHPLGAGSIPMCAPGKEVSCGVKICTIIPCISNFYFVANPRIFGGSSTNAYLICNVIKCI